MLTSNSNKPEKPKPLTPALGRQLHAKKRRKAENAVSRDGFGGRMGRRIAKDIGGKSGNEHSLGNSTTRTMHTRSTHIHTTHQPELNPACTYAIESYEQIWSKFGTKFKAKLKTQKSHRPQNRGSFLLSTHITMHGIASFFLSCSPPRGSPSTERLSGRPGWFPRSFRLKDPVSKITKSTLPSCGQCFIH